MPPLKQRIRSETPEGYAAQAEMPATNPTPKEPGLVLGGNKYIRTPLPPFNATSDTLRQFNENGKIPARRVIPLPPQAGTGGATTIIQNTSVSSTSGGSGGNVPTTPVKTITIIAPTLIPGDAAVFTVSASKIAVLMKVGASDLCEVRVYGDPASQASDVPRPSDTAPPFEVTQGLVTDVILDSSPLEYDWQNRLFVNQDAPQTTNFYITIINPTASAVAPSVTITYLPLE